MSTRQNLQIVQDAYAAIGQGQIPRLIDLMSSDVEIRVPGPTEIPFAGTYRGHEGVGQFFLAIAESADVEQFVPTEFIADDDQVVVIGHERLSAKPTGRTWNTDWVMVWTVEAGEITALREFHQTAAIAEAFTVDGP